MGTAVHLDSDLAGDLDRIAVSTGRARDDLVAEAVTRYLSHERLAAARIEAGLRRAEASELASDDEVERAFRKYGAPDPSG